MPWKKEMLILAALISTLGIPGLFPALPVVMTLFLLGWNLALSLILNDSVKVLLLRRLNLGGASLADDVRRLDNVQMSSVFVLA